MPPTNTPKFDVHIDVEVTATVTLTEGQLAALEAMAGYGADAFLRAFYIKLGKHYMKPFERDLRSLFDAIGEQVVPTLRRVRVARTHLAQAKKEAHRGIET